VRSRDSAVDACALIDLVTDSDNNNEDKELVHGCTLPCKVLSTVKYSLTPRVDWRRMISFTDRTLVPIRDASWLIEHGLDFDYSTIHNDRCNKTNIDNDPCCSGDKCCLVSESIGNYIYDCSVFVPKCRIENESGRKGHLIQGVDFQCKVESERSNAELVQCARPNPTGFEGPRPPPCYQPIPVQFDAVYNNTTGITWSWSVRDRLPHSKNCTGLSMTIEIRLFDNYRAADEEGAPSQFLFMLNAPLNSIEYNLGMDRVLLGKYYVLSVQILGEGAGPVFSPIYFFGPQGEHFASAGSKLVGPGTVCG
jgi:hypothetical protein